MAFRYEDFDLSGIRTYPLASRQSKARAEDFAKPVNRGGSFKSWFESLPAILGGADVRRVVDAIVTAKKRDAGIVWGIGAHVIKTGVSPVLIDLMERGYVSALAMNGAPMSSAPPSSMLYFSIATLTATGMSDILPVHPIARTLCSFEMITGVLFLAVLIARLAGSYPLPTR